MGRSTKSRPSGPVLPLNLSFKYTLKADQFSASPPSDLLSPSPSSAASTTFASSSSTFTSPSSSSSASIFRRSSSPTRVNIYSTSPPPPSSMRISINRSLSPSRSVSVRDQIVAKNSTVTKKTCTCSPTTHPGSFRCNLHRNLNGEGNSRNNQSISCSPSRLNLRRSAMKNSLVRIGTVEGDWVRRALTALIRPSSHHQRRRADFQPRPSRLSAMSNAGDECDAASSVG